VGIDIYTEPYFETSTGNSVSGNSFTNDGLFCYESYQNSAENNTVNGKPLVYLENVSNYEVQSAGQVVLCQCSNITVEGLSISQTDYGIEILATNNSNISGNNVTNNGCGIYFGHSAGNTLLGNNIASNGIGIQFYHCWYNDILTNSLENNTVQTSSTSAQSSLPGDLNLDGRVGLDDLVLLAHAYGSKPGDSNWNAMADITAPHGKIDLADLVTLATHYGQRYP
jgi:parallel beta-helix repeat protein